MTISLVEEKKTCEDSDAIAIKHKKNSNKKERPNRKEIKEKGGGNQEEIKKYD